MSTQNTTAGRSWTANEEPGVNKWLPITLLSILLLVGVYLLAKYLRPAEAPQTFFVAIAITEYNEQLLPKPAFPVWDVENTIADFPKAGLVSWQFVMSETPSETNKIDGIVGSLDRELKQSGIHARDTVVVYLRGHAIAYRGEAFLLSEGFERSDLKMMERADDDEPSGKGPSGKEPSDQQPNMSHAVRLTDILQQLQSLPAGNVVLLADICDLSTAPKLGIIANNVPKLLSETLAKLGGDGKTPLWVITSAASLQPTHASFLKEQTLLQSACEYACDSGAEKGAKYLSLARFYEAILRYSHHVTGGTQTPLLLRSGSRSFIADYGSNLNLNRWRDADEVAVARITDRVLPQNDEAEDPNDENTAANATQSFQQRPAGRPNQRFIAFLQDASAGTADSETSSDADAADLVEVTVEERSPWLRFWQLRDDLLDRKNNAAGWSPVDFAADHWRRSELNATRLERLHRIGSLSDSSEMEGLVADLSQLVDAFETGNTRAASTGVLLNAWSDFKRNSSPSTGKLPWTNPDALPGDQQIVWRQIREGYRVYFDAMSQSSGWLDMGLHERSGDRSKVLKLVNDLVSALSEAAHKLPQADADVALDFPLRPESIEGIRDAISAINAQVDEQVSKVLKRLERLARTATKVTWSDERTLQRLLRSTNLNYPQRRRLVTAYDELSLKDLEEPGTDNNPVDGKLELVDLLATPGTTGALTDYAQWCVLLDETLKLATSVSIDSVSGDTAEKLNHWGSQLLASFRTGTPPSGPTQRWNQSCLSDLVLFRFSEASNAALIVSVSNDTSIDVFIPNVHQLFTDASSQTTLDCEVKKRNGDPVDQCYLKWELTSSTDSDRRLQDVLSVRIREDLEPGKPHPVSARGGVVALRLKTEMDQRSLGSGQDIKMRVAISDTIAGLEAPQAWHTVDVYPPNPDRIELHAKYLSPGVGADEVIAARDESFGPVLNALRVPAISGQAKSRYELYLSNRSDREKVAIASLYSVVSNAEVGNGTISHAAANLTLRQLQGRKPSFKSDPIILPKNDSRPTQGLPANRRRIVFRPIGESDESGNAAGASLNIGEFGLLCVIQEVEIIDGSLVNKPIEPSYHWVECVLENPQRRLVSVVPHSTPGAFVLDVSVRHDDWSRWEIEELTIVANVTDLKGEDVRCSGSKKIVLTPDQSTGQLRLRPAQEPTEILVAHLDIGGYPRAIALQSRLRGGIDETRSATQGFVWLDRSTLVCTPDEGDQPIATEQLRNGLVIPSRANADGQSEGTEISVATISGPVQIDFPDNGLPAKAVISLESFRAEYEVDRQFIPHFDLDGGNLVFSATAEDLRYQINAAEYGFNGKTDLKAIVGDRSDPVSRSFELIFDHQPPTKASVEVDMSDLYIDDTMEVTINATDLESTVGQVFFAIDQEGFDRDRFDPKDLLHLEARNFGGRWRATLAASDVGKEIPRGNYSIVCRSIDIAGNIQDQNIRQRFQWTGRERPVNKPKPKPRPKKKTPPPPPTEHTVYVEVTVGGKKPPYPKNTAVSGVAGAREVNNGGTWVFTKVPDGSYDLTATYTDPLGVKFEGKGQLTLSGSGKRITIDVQKTK